MNAPAPIARKPGMLDRMVVHCMDRATDIEVTEDVAVQLGLRAAPIPDRLALRQLYLDMARLVDLVRMVEPDFRVLVKKRLGEVKREQPPAPIAPAAETGEENAASEADGVGATA